MTRLLAALLFLCAMPTPAFAGLAEYRATGIVIEIDDEQGIIPAAELGATFTATLVIDPGVTDIAEFNDSVGNYPQVQGSALEWRIGDLFFAGVPERVTVVNDFQTETGFMDTVQAFDNAATLVGNTGGDPGTFRLSLSLYDFSGTALDSDAFPAFIDVADFLDFPYLQATAPSQFHIAGHIQTLVLVPEPRAWALLALGLGVFLSRCSRASAGVRGSARRPAAPVRAS